MIGDDGDLRDYFDVLVIQRGTGHRVEEALAVALDRHRPVTPDAVILHIVRARGYLGDVADDPALPMDRHADEAYWATRQSKSSAPSTG